MYVLLCLMWLQAYTVHSLPKLKLLAGQLGMWLYEMEIERSEMSTPKYL